MVGLCLKDNVYRLSRNAGQYSAVDYMVYVNNANHLSETDGVSQINIVKFPKVTGKLLAGTYRVYMKADRKVWVDRYQSGSVAESVAFDTPVPAGKALVACGVLCGGGHDNIYDVQVYSPDV